MSCVVCERAHFFFKICRLRSLECFASHSFSLDVVRFCWHISCFCIRLCLNWFLIEFCMRKAVHAFGFILYCGDIVFQLAMIQVCHRQRSEWSCQCGACHVGEQGGHGTTLLQNVEAEGVTIGMFGRSCVIANYRSPSSMHENKDELKGGWGHWFFFGRIGLACACFTFMHWITICSFKFMSNVWSIVSNRLFPVTWGGTCRKDSFAFQPIGCGEDWCHHICHEAWLKQAIQRTLRVGVASRHKTVHKIRHAYEVPSKHTVDTTKCI